ncbi:MAG: VapC toxin family PIN domain ribonuclease [Actinomycetia bacterium]|nr:VapC toxin family PIN domain ribonuclease [Actinomycetes bacterium]
MPAFLLDSAVAIAAAFEEHEHNERVQTWMAGVESLALCPITQGALFRYALRLGESVRTAHALLNALAEDERVAFWPDDLSYSEVPFEGVRGHRQVTDVYLAHLATVRAGLLATLDEGLHQLRPQATLLIPG